MLITLDGTPLLGTRTGIGRYVEHLVAELPGALARRGDPGAVRVTTWSARGARLGALPPGVRQVPASFLLAWAYSFSDPVALIAGPSFAVVEELGVADVECVAEGETDDPGEADAEADGDASAGLMLGEVDGTAEVAVGGTCPQPANAISVAMRVIAGARNRPSGSFGVPRCSFTHPCWNLGGPAAGCDAPGCPDR